MGAARDVGKGLVDGNPLDERREIADHIDGGVAQPLVFLEMPIDEGELRTEFTRLPSRHAAADPEGLGFVRSGKHNPTTDGNGFAAQRRVKQLLYGGIEGIQVRMEDGGCRCHPDRSPVTFRSGSRRENIMRTRRTGVKRSVNDCTDILTESRGSTGLSVSELCCGTSNHRDRHSLIVAVWRVRARWGRPGTWR